MSRGLIVFFIGLVVFIPFNVAAWKAMTRIHPRRKRWIVAVFVVGNLMWPFFPFVRDFTPFSRISRAVLGPPWFAWTSIAILYTALALLVLLVWIPLRKRMAYGEVGRWPSRIFLSLVIVGSVVGIYHALVPLRVERVAVTIPNLPPRLEGKRLALLGDLHVGLFTRMSRLDRIFSTTSSLRPDVALIAGDMIDDDPHFTPKLLAGTRALDPSIPLFGVYGNHEIYGDPQRVAQQMRGSRIRLLVNEGAHVDGLWIAGISDRAANSQPGAKALAPNAASALRGKPADAVAIALSHQPSNFAEARKLGIPLTLAAHTHGGQMGFRPLRISLAGLFLDRHMGLYREGDAQLYINTGTGYWLLPFRLGMTPEITLVELRAGSGSAPPRRRTP